MRNSPLALLLVSLSLLLGSCGGASEPPPTGAAGATGAAGNAGAGAAGGQAAGHTLTLKATLEAEGGEIAFLTPAASIFKHRVGDVIGRPYYVAAFPSGFSPGNDPALADVWGVVPPSLEIAFTTPPRFADGPYDMVMVVYVTTPITDAMRRGEVPPPPAKGGDLASFTLSQVNVRPGDPRLEAGLVRVNVQAADGRVEITNRRPADIRNGEQTRAAFDNTVLAVP